MKLYDYFRSSAAYRVRIALNLKGQSVERAHVHLRKGEQQQDPYLALNPLGLVPLIETDDGARLTQSLAIIDYLDARYPTPRLIPVEPVARARVQALAQLIVCEMHPLNNLRVLQYLTGPLALSETTRDAWYAHWCEVGLNALETQLAREHSTGRFCHGDAPTLADVCLVPQLANARRVALDVARWPTIARIEIACNALPAFVNAAPAKQPDAE